jgi:rhodanese-related sulfurtransferase
MRKGGRNSIFLNQETLMKTRSALIACGLSLACAVPHTTFAGPGTNDQAAKPTPPAAKAGAGRRVQVDEFEKLWRDKRNVVLDVRTKREFDAGHIPGARNLDIHDADFDRKIAELNKDKLYLVHCAAGVRSAKACAIMSGLGFTNSVDLAPGFQAWLKAGKPVEK